MACPSARPCATRWRTERGPDRVRPRPIPVGGAGGPIFSALRGGPMEPGGGRATASLGFDDEAGLLRPPVVERDDEAGLGQLLAGAPPGSALRCEPRLVKAGGRLGFEPAPLPEDVIAIRATLALRFSLGTSSKDIGNPDVLFELAGAAAAFVRAAPWNHWNDES